MPKEAKKFTNKTAHAASTKQSSKKQSKAKSDAPKRGSSSYIFFMKENREVIKNQNPLKDGKEITKLLGEAWKNLSEEEKKPYKEMAEQDKARYDAEKAAYNQSSKSNGLSQAEVASDEEDK